MTQFNFVGTLNSVFKRPYEVYITKKVPKIDSYLILQLLLASALVASSVALPAGPPPPYHAPAPIPHHAPAYKIPPRPFAYAYGVADEYSGTNFDKKETQVRSFMAKFVTNLSTIVVIE